MTDVRELGLSSPIGQVDGVHPSRAARFSHLGIHTVGDLLRHLPQRYEHESAESTIGDLPMEAIGSARGTIMSTRWIPAARSGGKGRFQAVLEDHRDQIYLVWFNAGYLRQQLHPGVRVLVRGKVGAFGGCAQIVNPKWQPLDEADDIPVAAARLRPIYPATQNLTSEFVEHLIAAVLPLVENQIQDPLPQSYVEEHMLLSLVDAIKHVHQPNTPQEAARGRRRLAYNELLLLQLAMAIKRRYNQHKLTAPALKWTAAIDEHIKARFGFKLTDAQVEVIREIAEDLQQKTPMNRLLQGDVGAGKTVVALYGLLMAVCCDKQGALMAPTELLAEQHFQAITDMLRGSTVRLALLTSGACASGSKERKQLLHRIRSGEVDIVVGTQALITESVRFKELALIVIDEQHRFGVLQRAAFRQRGDGQAAHRSPHCLVMTATPIPRTLSLTAFADLDISTIRQLPPGRTPIITRAATPSETMGVYEELATRVKEGEQAYVVVPTVEESDSDSSLHLKSVREHKRKLEQRMPGVRIAAIHGQLKPSTRESIMHRFRRRDIQVLVATTVIEVGVDVPSATFMIIEHAERFGLAQLHQLRGRIGRGVRAPQSMCVLIADPSTPQAKQRVEAICSTRDGFLIAERDLQIRGMGDFFGTRQHGLPPLRVARIADDMQILLMARRDAQAIVAKDPLLEHATWNTLRKILLQQYGDALGLIDVG